MKLTGFWNNKQIKKGFINWSIYPWKNVKIKNFNKNILDF